MEILDWPLVKYLERLLDRKLTIEELGGKPIRYRHKGKIIIAKITKINLSEIHNTNSLKTQ